MELLPAELGNEEPLRIGSRLGPYDASAGLAVFHALRGQFAEAAQFAERAIDERYPPFVGIIRPLLQSTPQWHVLAKRMKLPAGLTATCAIGAAHIDGLVFFRGVGYAWADRRR